MHFYYISILLLFIKNNNCLFPLTPSEDYTHVLRDDEIDELQYIVYWKTLNKDEIQFEVHCKSTGWVGLGLSPNGGMASSDITIGWVDSDNNPHLKDCFATEKNTPKIDDHQDVFLIEGAQINGYTILKFKRKLNTCDIQDRAIEFGTIYLIYAWNDKDPVSGLNDWEYHGNNRFQKAEILLNNKVETINYLPDDAFSYSMMMPNVSIPNKDTFYYCQLFQVPEYSEPVHFIQYEMVIQPGNKNLVHHVLGYECSSEFDPQGVFGEECGHEPSYMTSHCVQQMIIAWGVGGKNLVRNYSFPQEAGYPFKPSLEKRYFMLEMHYDNPNLQNGRTDSSGVKLYLTKQLRTHELGSVILGVIGGRLQLQIPPHTDSIKFTGICYPECTQEFVPPEGVNLVSGLLHTHLAGRTIRTNLVRNGKVIKRLFNDPTYDFNYQFIIDIEPTKLYQGDALITECVYQTNDRSAFSYYGQGTRDEMCFNFVYYYPRIPYFYNCVSKTPTPVLFDFYRSLMKESLIPYKYLNASSYNENDIKDFFNKNVTTTEKLIEKFKKFEEDHNRLMMCGAFVKDAVMLYNESVPDYKPIDNLIEFDPCKTSIASLSIKFNIYLGLTNIIFYIIHK